MTANRLEVIDSTVHLTNEWLNQVEQRLEIKNKHEAYRVLRAVLHALRDQLDVDESAQLSAQLPLLVRGIYYEGWKPRDSKHMRSAEEFENLVHAHHGARPYKNAKEMISAVTDVLAMHVEPSELDQVFSRCPLAVRNLLTWTSVFA
jgi:uncharacterized protein (DUF2267 family)